ncbi:MAG: AsmA-like C-terminal region-containing protein [Bacteroidales bacterium]
MKKLFKIVGLTILFILLLLILIPIIFKGKILETVKTQINNNVNAKVEFEDLKLSLLRGFPYAYIALEDLSVSGVDKFEGDTLLRFNSFSIKTDLISAIKMENIDIRAIILENPVISARVLKDGTPNWDIVKADTSEVAEPEDTTATEMPDFNVELNKFEISSAYIYFVDESTNMTADIENLNFLMKGDMSKDFTTLDISSSVNIITVVNMGIAYLKNASMNLDVAVDADMVNNKYTLRENSFKLNELGLNWNGEIEMNDESTRVDISFTSLETSFKSVLSMVPAVYMNDFPDVTAGGSFNFSGFVKGVYTDEVMPSASLDFVINDGMFKYPDLPSAVENINMDMHAFYNGVEPDSTTVDVNKFHMDIAGNPVDFELNVKTPTSDPWVNGLVKTNLNLESFKDVVPLENTEYKGIIDANVDFLGNLSSLENERYDEFKFDGRVILKDIYYSSPDVPQPVAISSSELIFSPAYLDLKSFNMKMGASDFQLSGKIADFMGFALKDETLKADFAFFSNSINVNEFLTETPGEEVEQAEDTVALTVFEVPGNIHFFLSTRINDLLYDNIQISNITGVIEILNNAAYLNNLKMSLLDGTIIMNGEYNTLDLESPFMEFGLDVNNIDIQQTAVTFATVDKFVPVAKSARGKVTAGIEFTSFLQDDMTPEMNSIVGGGRLQSKQVSVSNPPAISKVGDKLGIDKYREVTFDDIDISFEIREGRVYVEPFSTSFGSTDVTIQGDQGIDQTMNYTMAFEVPKSSLGSAADQVMGNLQSAASDAGIDLGSSPNLNILAKVTGEFGDPDVSFSMRQGEQSMQEAVKEQVKAEVKEKVEEVKTEVKDKASEEAQKMIAKAEREAASIREEARKAAELVREEAENSAQQIEKEAEGKPKFARDLAKKAADKIRKEGDEKADKIVVEANKKAEKIIAGAKNEAEKLN